MKKSYVIIVIFILIICGCSSKNMLKSRDLNVKIDYSEDMNSYQKDLLYLAKVLEDSHPNIYENYPKESFHTDKEKLLKEFENIEDDTEFLLKLQHFVAKIGDAHTKVNIDHLFNSKNKYPIKLHWIKNDLYILDIDKKFPEKLHGAQVLKFNSYPIDEVVEKCGSIVSAENDIWIKYMLKNFLVNPIFLKHMKVAKSSDSLQITISNKSREESIILHPQKKVKWKDKIVKHEITAKKWKPHSYRIFPEKKICYYQFNKFFDRKTINSFIKNQLNWLFRPFGYIMSYLFFPDYNKFLNKMFADIEKNDIDKLIIDLRHNSGGSSILGRLLMYHCTMPDSIQSFSVTDKKISELLQNTYSDNFKEYNLNFELPKLLTYEKSKPQSIDSFFSNLESKHSIWKVKKDKKKFSGKIILLVGPKTFSSASDFATTLSDNKIATLVGEAIGQKPTSFGDILIFELPETKTMVTVSWKVFRRPDSSKDREKSLFPDIEIYPTIDEVLEGKDPVFEKAMEL